MWHLKVILCIQLFFWANYFVNSDNRENSIVSATDCNVEDNEPWSYGERNGPHKWGVKYKSCSGRKQSPIAVTTSKATRSSTLTKLAVKGYDNAISRATILNNGRTIELSPSDGIKRSLTINDSMYSFKQLHFHWGDSNNYGSEHMINGIKHSMEMHLVHQNKDHEFAVIAVFFHEEHKRNKELEKIIHHFPQILYKNTTAQLTSAINLSILLPSNLSSYFRYNGSLTTPGCDEKVIWSLLTHPQPVGIDQMAEFRKLYCTAKNKPDSVCHMSNNFRPIQELHDRTVYICSN